MTSVLVAEVLSGDAAITPGGVVDRVTAMGCDEQLWGIAPLSRDAVASRWGWVGADVEVIARDRGLS